MSDESIKLAGYEWRKSLGKAVKAFALQAAAVVILALAGWLSNPVAMADALKDVPGALYLVPILASVGAAMQNWWKHKDD